MPNRQLEEDLKEARIAKDEIKEELEKTASNMESTLSQLDSARTSNVLSNKQVYIQGMFGFIEFSVWNS